MKKCAYCGRENPDDATQCCECGTQGFAVGTSSQLSEQERRIRRTKILVRVLIAIGVWLAVSGISIYNDWLDTYKSDLAWFEQLRTQYALKDINALILEYHQKSNAIPRTLDEIRSIATTGNVRTSIGFKDDGTIDDGWNRPFLFSSDATNCLVTSYGRDGKPGGIGVDCDLTSKNPTPNESLPTFDQFLHNERVQGMIKSSLVCGVLAAILSFLTVRVPDFNRRGMIVLGLSLCVTLIGTLLVTAIITALHVPSGH